MKVLNLILVALFFTLMNVHAATDSEFVKLHVELDYGICYGEGLCDGDTITFSPLEMELVRQDSPGMKAWHGDWEHQEVIEGEKFTFRIRASHYIFKNGKESWSFFPEIYRKSIPNEGASVNIHAPRFEDLDDVQLGGTEVNLEGRSVITWLRMLPFSKIEKE